MNNQICPWKADSQSEMCQGPSALLQAYQTVTDPCFTQNSCHKRRPSTSTQPQYIYKQKKNVRPFSSERNKKRGLKTSALIIQQRNIFFPKSQSFSKSNLISIKNIGHTNTQPQLRKKLAINTQTIFTTYSNFMKQKLKRQDRLSIVPMNAGENFKNKQEMYTKNLPKQQQPFLNKKLMSVLKLSKTQTSLLKNGDKQQNRGDKAVIKKTGFVYYNQSFFPENILRIA